MKWWQKTLDFFKWRQNIIKNYWLNYWSWIGSRVYLIINSCLLVLCFGLAILIMKNISQDIVILHYNVIFGNDFIGQTWRIILLPISALVINIINIIMAVRGYAQDKLLSHIAQLTAATITAITILGLYTLYLINFVSIKF